MEELLGFTDQGQIWQPLENPLVTEEIGLSMLHWGMELEMVSRGVRSSADVSSSQYLKILLYGALNSISALNNLSGMRNEQRLENLKNIIADYGLIPHWNNTNEESHISHELWFAKNPNYYILVNGYALKPMVWSPADTDTDEMIKKTKLLWKRTRACIFEIGPSGPGCDPRSFMTIPEFSTIPMKSDDPGNEEICGMEDVDLEIEGPIIRSKKPGVDDPISSGELESLAWNRVRSEPNDPVYENIFEFVSPVSTDISPDVPKRSELILPNVAYSSRRNYVTHLLRWFIKYQCKIELNAIHYMYLAASDLLPDIESEDILISRRSPILNPYRILTGATPFRSIYGYEIFKDTLQAHMHAFQRKCYPHVFFPLENMLDDMAWLETFPVTIEEVKFMIMFILDESFRVTNYTLTLKKFGHTMEEEQTKWIESRLENASPWMNFLGELVVLVQDNNVSIHDNILEDAWDQWKLLNNLNGVLTAIHKDALDSTRKQLQNLRRILPNPNDKDSPQKALPSVIHNLVEIRQMVLSRWKCWLYGYKPFKESEIPRTIRAAYILERNAADKIMSARRNGNIDRKKKLNNATTDLEVATFLHNSFAGAITCDIMGRTLAYLIDSIQDDNGLYHLWFSERKQYVELLREYIELWDLNCPVQRTITSAIHYMRVAFLRYVYYAPYMDAVFARPQLNPISARTYSLDALDIERDLHFAYILQSESSRIAVPLVFMRSRPSTFLENPHMILMMHMPWNRNWKTRKTFWEIELLNLRKQEEETFQSNASFMVRVPDQWIIRATRDMWTDTEMPLRMNYTWNWVSEISFDGAKYNADNPVELSYDFKIRGTIRILITQ